MKSNTRPTPETLARPLGDDWLTRDPESFGEGLDDDGALGSSRRGSHRWRRVADDLVLYGAGITTGLMVVTAAWLLLQLVASPDSAVEPPLGAAETAVVERVATN